MNTPSEDDYKTIEAAVMETARGRWFLAEFARRNRNADTEEVLSAIGRVESRVAAPAPTAREEDEAVSRVRFGILEMADAIARTKAEIAAIRADGDDMGRFEEASVELDAIVDQTEKATSTILASAESVQEVAWTLREMNVDSEACDMLDAKATDIYTACSFQDLTGQRTRKVIQVLRYLEQRVNSMGAIWTGQEVDDSAAPPPPPQLASNRRPDGHLLNGPALPGQGLEQTDIDAMLGHEQQPAAASDPVSEEEHIRHLRQKAEAIRQSEATPQPARRVTLEAPLAQPAEQRVVLEPAAAAPPQRRAILEPPPAPPPQRRAVLEPPPAPPPQRRAVLEPPPQPAPPRSPVEVNMPGLPAQGDIEKLNFVEKLALFS